MAGTLTIGAINDGTNTGNTTDMIKGSARAWVNFNGIDTVAIRASYNVSSITDNGVGDYTVNFTTAMVDANYSMSGTCRDAPPSDAGGVVIAGRDDWIPTISNRRFNTIFGSTLYDVTEASVIIFR